jgi:hypothetical protein
MRGLVGASFVTLLLCLTIQGADSRRRRRLELPPTPIAIDGVFAKEVIKHFEEHPKHVEFTGAGAQDAKFLHRYYWKGYLDSMRVHVMVVGMPGRNRLGALMLTGRGYVEREIPPDLIRAMADYAQSVLADPDEEFVKFLERVLSKIRSTDGDLTADGVTRRYHQRYTYRHLRIDVKSWFLWRGSDSDAYYAFKELCITVSGLQFRNWTDSTGRFQRRAGYIEHDDETVRLVREDGREITAPLNRLSEKDREWLEDAR